MSKRKAPKTTSPAPKANGMKLVRELMGLILLFFGFYLLLSLISFDSSDPGFNHAISTATNVQNSAGIIGSYLAGMLTDIFGIASYIWPVFFLLLSIRQLFYTFSVQWWRVLGFICLLLCLMMAGTAWDLSLGNIIGGGFIGNTIYGFTWKFLSGIGSLLVGICFFLISLQLMFNISWLAVLRSFWLWLVTSFAHFPTGNPDGNPDGKGNGAHKKARGNMHNTANESNATGSINNEGSKQKKRAPVKDMTLESQAHSMPDSITHSMQQGSSEAVGNMHEQGHGFENFRKQDTEKKGFLENIKGFFAFKKQDQSVQQDVQALQESNVLSEDAVYAMQEKKAFEKSAALQQEHAQQKMASQHIAPQQGVAEDHFLSDTNALGLNPFASPWARASDIEAEWSSFDSADSTQNVANMQGTYDALQQPQHSLANGALPKSTPEIVLPQSIIPAAQNAPTQSQNHIENFLFDNEPHDGPESVHSLAMHVVDGIDNAITSGYEIDLDATMAVSAKEEYTPTDSVDSVVGIGNTATSNHGAESDVFSNEFLNEIPNDFSDGFTHELENDAPIPPNSSYTLGTSDKTDGIDAEVYIEDMPVSSDISEYANTSLYNDSAEPDDYFEQNDTFAQNDSFEPADNLGHNEAMPASSFEVLMDADKDGITDLTEEEVGIGSAAKAAPVKIKTQLPHLDLLQDIFEDESAKPRIDILTEKGERLTRCLADFGIQGELTRITPGPVVTMFEFRPAPGIKVSRIANLSDDLSLALKAIAVRIQAPIPGTDTVGIEIPNEIRETVYFKELLASETFYDASSLLTIAVGKDSAGRPSVADLAKMPHLLVAGATGAGKSVCLNSILLSFLYKARPEDVQLLLIDPKRIELAVYADLPHLVHPVVTDMSHAKNALDWAVHEMDKRYEGMARLGVRNIAGYNQKLEAYGSEKPIEFLDLEFMPYLVIIIDELADLMMTAAKEVEMSIVRLAQLARAAGIHMVLATQRPSVDVVTGIIKANFPCRISFQVTSKHDSRTILDTVGAEHLLGRGDMLFKPSGGRLQRLHGAFVSDDEVCNVVEFWKRQQAPMYRVDFAEWGTEGTQDNLEGGAGALADDPVYNDAVEFVMSQGRASISLVQRRFRIGFNKAARYVEQMEQDGIIGPADGSKPRLVIKGREL